MYKVIKRQLKHADPVTPAVLECAAKGFSHNSTGAVMSALHLKPDIAAGKLVRAMCMADPDKTKWSRPACIIWILGFAWCFYFKWPMQSLVTQFICEKEKKTKAAANALVKMQEGLKAEQTLPKETKDKQKKLIKP